MNAAMNKNRTVFLVPQTDIAVLFKHVDVLEFCSATLPRNVGQCIACSGTYTYYIWESDTAVHEIVEYANGEDATHTTALKDK